MLKIWYMEGIEFNNCPQLYFRHAREDEWLLDPMVQEMIQDVDKSTVISPHLIESSVLGPIPPERLSGGVQILILMLKDDEFTQNISKCGDNCAKWILKIAEQKDLTVFLEHIMRFEGEFEIQIMNTGRVVHNPKEYLDALLEVEDLINERDNQV